VKVFSKNVSAVDFRLTGAAALRALIIFIRSFLLTQSHS